MKVSACRIHRRGRGSSRPLLPNKLEGLNLITGRAGRWAAGLAPLVMEAEVRLCWPPSVGKVGKKYRWGNTDKKHRYYTPATPWLTMPMPSCRCCVLLFLYLHTHTHSSNRAWPLLLQGHLFAVPAPNSSGLAVYYIHWRVSVYEVSTFQFDFFPGVAAVNTAFQQCNIHVGCFGWSRCVVMHGKDRQGRNT